MMHDYEQLDSGLYVPPLRADVKTEMNGMINSPMMQYLTMSIFSGWAWDEGNWETLWNLPVYSQLAMIQEVTMTGVDLIKERKDLEQSKGWAVISMMARGITLARMSCVAMATGSISDAFSIYRMLLDRLITLKYLDENDQYEAFANFSYADLYHTLNSRLNDSELKESYASGEIKAYKDMMALIRDKYFQGRPPRKPQSYWKPPHTKDLVETAFGNDGGLQQKQESQIYELGNRSVHPWVRDLIQPEESDINPQDFTALTMVTAADLSIFGLSRYSVTSPLAVLVERIVLVPPQPDIPVWEHVTNTRISIEKILANSVPSPGE